MLWLGLFLAGCAGTKPAEELPEDHWSRNPAAVPFMKIGRGVVNIAASPLDIPGTMIRVCGNRENYAYGAGLFEGIFNGVVRLGAGVVEILSFPLVHQPDPLYERDLGEPVFRRQEEAQPEPEPKSAAS